MPRSFPLPVLKSPSEPRTDSINTHPARPPKRQGDTLTLRRRPCSDTNLVPVLTQTSTFNFESKFAVLTICSDNLKRNGRFAKRERQKGERATVEQRQDRHDGSRQQTRSWDGLLRSQEPRDRAEEAAARQQQAETPQHKAQCAGPAVQVDAKAASKTAASGHARPLAPPPRRSLAPPPNGPCSSATLAAETALVAAKAIATAVAARLNVGSAASPQPGRRSPCPGRRPSRRCPQPRQISGMGSSGRRRRLAPRPQRSLQRRGRSTRRWRSHQPSCRCSHFARSRAVLATF